MALDEYTGVGALGGSETFTCEYSGVDAVSSVSWTYNDGALPDEYSFVEVSIVYSGLSYRDTSEGCVKLNTAGCSMYIVLLNVVK